MKFRVIPSTVDSASLLPLPAFTSSCLKSFNEVEEHRFQLNKSKFEKYLSEPGRSSGKGVDHQLTSLAVLSTSFLSKNLTKSQSLNKIPRGRKVRRSCSANLEEIGHDGSPVYHVEGLGKNYGHVNNEESKGANEKTNCAVSMRIPGMGGDQSSFLESRIDFLEPMMLGIRPEFMDRPGQETAVWATIEQKAKSLDIPLSLRMIKKKLQCDECFIEPKEAVYCSVKAAFCSMVFIIVELQSYALQMREALCNEDLDAIVAKVQKEMNSSFVWLFQQVFSKTPALMVYVMILLANFSVYSATSYDVKAEISHLGRTVTESMNHVLSTEERNLISTPKTSNGIAVGNTQLDQLGNLVEMSMSSSVVGDATKIQDGVEEEALNLAKTQNIVSPLSIELEPDVCEDHLRTDLLYQMNLSFEPDNPLLLCNYAQFLHLVAHDYDRAEQCFKRAVQIPRPDAESLSLYANFLWIVRRDFSAAEERFLQALAADPENSYYASRYANFLWNSGGDETCFPPSVSHNTNL